MPNTRHMSYYVDMAPIEDVNLTRATSRSSIVLGRSIPYRRARASRAHWTNGSTVHDVHQRRYDAPISSGKALMYSLFRLLFGWLRRLDAESISTFQSMYYVVFSITAVLLIFFPDFHVQYVSTVLGRGYYDAWVLVNLICPTLTLIGRRFTTRAAMVRPGEQNFAYGAAWLQLCGDSGVWGNVLVYVGSMIATDWWSKEIYVFAFLLMGVAGGGMFTIRSVRRIVQIKQLERRSRESGCQM